MPGAIVTTGKPPPALGATGALSTSSPPAMDQSSSQVPFGIISAPVKDEDQIFIDYEDEEYEERDSEITTEMAERETEITETETETSSIRSKELRQARVWKHFEKKTIEKDDEQTETYILCHICEGHFSANNSTTTLERHLKAKHFDVYKDLGQVESNAKPWTVDIQQEKHNLFVNWIITDQQPFTIVENQSFKKFIASIQPKYKIPSRHTIKDMIMKKFENAQIQIKNYLQLSTSKISLTMDMWTTISSLDVLYIPSPHTALAIKDSIIKIVLELNIADRLIGITSDNEAKMLVATRLIKEDLNLSEFCHYHCAAHILNLAVEAALNTSIVPNCVKKLRIFISTVRNSPKQMDKLKEFFQVEKIKFKVPLSDCTTRWNYTFYMIDRALEIKPLLAHLISNLTSLSNNWPNEEEWNILTILADLLAPFASVTRVISASSYPTIGEVKLLFEGIRMHLNQSRGENFILQDQVDEMNRVFTNYFDEINEALHVPAFFDPCYKKLAYGDMSQNNIFEPIRRAMANYRESDDTHIPSQPIQASQRHLMNLSAIETRNFFRNLIAPNQTPQPVLNELELYFTSNSPGDEIVPLEW
ncbi:zinc finger BED domain-containing protein RICESLEEPER 2-like [Rhizophagus irregularis DAOM 181602=DAOM 197198]|nr:zinc finger BED domain-containing protein RICESLEEPER 2-like [Rhizophagus irregularis DAOM 181602=DAOM 197198]